MIEALIIEIKVLASNVKNKSLINPTQEACVIIY